MSKNFEELAKKIVSEKIHNGPSSLEEAAVITVMKSQLEGFLGAMFKLRLTPSYGVEGGLALGRNRYVGIDTKLISTDTVSFVFDTDRQPKNLVDLKKFQKELAESIDFLNELKKQFGSTDIKIAA